MWRRKYASNLYAGLLKSLREVQFDRTDIQPPILNEVREIDDELDEDELKLNEKDLANDDEPPVDIPLAQTTENDEVIQPFVHLRRSRRIAERQSI